MPSKKNFEGAMSSRRITSFKGEGNEKSGLGVVGNTLREELEKMAEDLSVQELEISRLEDNPYQYLARAKLDDGTLDELADSIRENGFFGALLARVKAANSTNPIYELAYGHRRREAAKIAGLEKLPVKIIELSDAKMARIMASENFSRQNLSTLGEANVIGYLYDSQNLTIEELALAVGKKPGWVRLRLAVHQAPQDIREMVEIKPDTLGHIRLLQQVTDKTVRARLINDILEHNLTREQLEERIDNLKNPALPNNVTNFTKVLLYQNSEIPHNQSPEIEPAKVVEVRGHKREIVKNIKEAIVNEDGQIEAETTITYLGKPVKTAVNNQEGLELLTRGLDFLENSTIELSDKEKEVIEDLLSRLQALVQRHGS